MVDDDGRVEAISQQVSACAFGQARRRLLGAQRSRARRGPKPRTALAELDALARRQRDDPGAWPGLAALAPARSKTGRHGAILLPFRALLAAIEAAR